MSLVDRVRRSWGLIIIPLLLSLSLLLAACGDSEAITLPTSGATTTGAAAIAGATTMAATTGAVTSIASTNAATTSAVTTAAARTGVSSTPVVATSAAAATTTTASAVTTARSATTAAAASSTRITQGQTATFAADTAYNHVKALADNNTIRFAGSENTKKAGDYIAKQFEAVGLKVSFQESKQDFLRDSGSTATLVGVTGGTPVKLKLLTAGAKTGPEVEGEAVIVDPTKPPDAATLVGKILVTGANTVSGTPDAAAQAAANQFFQRLLQAPASAAPLAVLIVVPNLTNQPSSEILSKSGTTFAYLEQAGSERIIEQARTGQVKLKLNLNAQNGGLALRNVIGTRAASSPTAPLLIIGGHYDTVAASPGANDNASGTAVVIELARVLAKAYPEVEMRFIAFDGEELGLLGSQDYASKMSAADKSRAVAMINIDMIVAGKLYLVGDAKFTGIAKGLAAGRGLREVEVVSGGGAGGVGSDHASFEKIGVPVLSFLRPQDVNYHRPTDTVEKFDGKPLEDIGQIVLGTLQRVLLSQE